MQGVTQQNNISCVLAMLYFQRETPPPPHLLPPPLPMPLCPAPVKLAVHRPAVCGAETSEEEVSLSGVQGKAAHDDSSSSQPGRLYKYRRWLGHWHPAYHHIRTETELALHVCLFCGTSLALYSCHTRQCLPFGKAMLCHAMLCYAVLCHAMSYYVILCHAVPCYAMPCHAISGGPAATPLLSLLEPCCTPSSVSTAFPPLRQHPPIDPSMLGFRLYTQKTSVSASAMSPLCKH